MLFIELIFYKNLVMSINSVFLLIDIVSLGIIFLLTCKGYLILKKIIKVLKLYKRRVDIFSAETQLKFILEN